MGNTGYGRDTGKGLGKCMAPEMSVLRSQCFWGRETPLMMKCPWVSWVVKRKKGPTKEDNSTETGGQQ